MWLYFRGRPSISQLHTDATQAQGQQLARGQRESTQRRLNAARTNFTATGSWSTVEQL